MLINSLAAGLLLLAVPIVPPGEVVVQGEPSQLPRPYSRTEVSRQFDAGLQNGNFATDKGNVDCLDCLDGNGYGYGRDCKGRVRRHRSYWHEWWHSPNNLIQHMPYYPTGHGYYYFRPYNYQHVRYHQEQVTAWGGDPRNPMSNHVFDRVYAELEAERPDLYSDELPEVPSLPPLPGGSSDEDSDEDDDEAPELPPEDTGDRESRRRTNATPTASQTQPRNNSQLRLKLVQ
jgi:hypothetical protein